jgi:hypothetical protein
MIPASGCARVVNAQFAGGPGFNSRLSPFSVHAVDAYDTCAKRERTKRRFSLFEKEKKKLMR